MQRPRTNDLDAPSTGLPSPPAETLTPNRSNSFRISDQPVPPLSRQSLLRRQTGLVRGRACARRMRIGVADQVLQRWRGVMPPGAGGGVRWSGLALPDLRLPIPLRPTLSRNGCGATEREGTEHATRERVQCDARQIRHRAGRPASLTRVLGFGVLRVSAKILGAGRARPESTHPLVSSHNQWLR
jgi:hypothetical protein